MSIQPFSLSVARALIFAYGTWYSMKETLVQPYYLSDSAATERIFQSHSVTQSETKTDSVLSAPTYNLTSQFAERQGLNLWNFTLLQKSYFVQVYSRLAVSCCKWGSFVRTHFSYLLCEPSQSAHIHSSPKCLFSFRMKTTRRQTDRDVRVCINTHTHGRTDARTWVVNFRHRVSGHVNAKRRTRTGWRTQAFTVGWSRISNYDDKLGRVNLISGRKLLHHNVWINEFRLHWKTVCRMQCLHFPVRSFFFFLVHPSSHLGFPTAVSLPSHSGNMQIFPSQVSVSQ